jgi:hypothetical protein
MESEAGGPHDQKQRTDRGRNHAGQMGVEVERFL